MQNLNLERGSGGNYRSSPHSSLTPLPPLPLIIHRNVFSDPRQRGRGPSCLKAVDTLWAVIGPRPLDLHSKRISPCPRSTNQIIGLPGPGPSHTRDRCHIHSYYHNRLPGHHFIQAHHRPHIRQVLYPGKNDRSSNPSCRSPSASMAPFLCFPLHDYLVVSRRSIRFSFSTVSYYVYSRVCERYYNSSTTTVHCTEYELGFRIEIEKSKDSFHVTSPSHRRPEVSLACTQ